MVKAEGIRASSDPGKPRLITASEALIKKSTRKQLEELLKMVVLNLYFAGIA